jgi:hypothetical protein
MMMIFRSDSRLLASVLMIAGRLVLGGMVGSQTMRAQQSPQPASIVSSNRSDVSKPTDLRLRSFREASNQGVRVIAGDKSYHGSVGT